MAGRAQGLLGRNDATQKHGLLWLEASESMSDMTDAPFGRRLAARLLDLLFALPLTFVMLIPVTIVMLPVLLALDEDSAAYDIAIAIGASAAYFLAYVALEWFLLVGREGQTLGKGLLGLRAVSSSDRPLHLGPALVRLVVLLAPFVLFSLAGQENGADRTTGGTTSHTSACSY